MRERMGLPWRPHDTPRSSTSPRIRAGRRGAAGLAMVGRVSRISRMRSAEADAMATWLATSPSVRIGCTSIQR